ncbi:PH domain-containing protein [Streptomyces finlayi]|uniref:PH domain-containing protein n=1 Tax=Streptomyces finlayi TaxID=67296 RepID=A0A7G7BJ77_9ACTN|nr:PH domain-containing protein [Streptomyces finlayi]QNE75392.1 PH domain-containing protein [Streptomyces finlayi]
MTSPTPVPEPAYADRTFRSVPGLVCGVLLIALTAWIGGDALFRGEGRTPWTALAGMLAVIPLVAAFTVRPVVSVNEDRVRIRNPFRTIVLPWSDVADVRAGYSTELFTQAGVKYQLWAVPVSLRERKRAARQAARQSQDDPHGRSSVNADVRDTAARVAAADRTAAELRELAEEAGHRKDATTTVTASVRWAYEVIAPATAGVVLLVVLLAIG